MSVSGPPPLAAPATAPTTALDFATDAPAAHGGPTRGRKRSSAAKTADARAQLVQADCPVCLEGFCDDARHSICTLWEAPPLGRAQAWPRACKHVLHEACARGWFARSAACPLCKRGVTMRVPRRQREHSGGQSLQRAIVQQATSTNLPGAGMAASASGGPPHTPVADAPAGSVRAPPQATSPDESATSVAPAGPTPLCQKVGMAASASGGPPHAPVADAPARSVRAPPQATSPDESATSVAPAAPTLLDGAPDADADAPALGGVGGGCSGGPVSSQTGATKPSARQRRKQPKREATLISHVEASPATGYGRGVRVLGQKKVP